MIDAQQDLMETGDSAIPRAMDGAGKAAVECARNEGSMLSAAASAVAPSLTDKPAWSIQRRSSIIGAIRIATLEPWMDGGF